MMMISSARAHMMIHALYRLCIHVHAHGRTYPPTCAAPSPSPSSPADTPCAEVQLHVLHQRDMYTQCVYIRIDTPLLHFQSRQVTPVVLVRYTPCVYVCIRYRYTSPRQYWAGDKECREPVPLTQVVEEPAYYYG